jgi:hypothetical protein
MPKYSAKLTNGKTITLEGDAQPTDEDFESAAKGAGVQLLPEGKTVEQYAAREEGDKHGATYLKDTLENIPGDAVEQVKGLADLAGTTARATGELGGSIGGRVRELVGLQPNYPEGTPNIDALAKLPFAIGQHYKDYIDPEKRAQMVRDHPVGLVGDVAGALEGVRSVTPEAVTKLANTPIGKPSPETVVSAGIGYAKGGPAGAVKGAANSGMVTRFMNMLRGIKTPVETPLLNGDADALRNSIAESQLHANGRAPNTRLSPLDIGGGRTSAPPVTESLRSQGESMLSPEAKAHADALGVSGPTGPVSTSAQDILTPQSMSMMDRMHAEANPVFRLMQKQGMFSGDRTTGPAPSGSGAPPADTSAVDAIRSIMSQQPRTPSTLDIGRTRGPGPIAQPTPPPNPNAGGRLAGRRMNPGQALDIALSGAPRGFAEGDTANVSMPEQVQPPVFMSPKARTVAGQPPTALETLEDTMRQREQSAAAQRYSPDLQVVEPSSVAQSAVGPQDAMSMIEKLRQSMKPAASHEAPVTPKKSVKTSAKGSANGSSPSIEDQYTTLSKKAILSPEEVRVLARLKTIMQGRASNIGLGYAAGGK